MADFPTAVYLHSHTSTLILDLQTRLPQVAYWGKRLHHINNSTDIKLLNQLSFRQEGKCSPITEPPISLTPGYGQGFVGEPGLVVANSADAWSTCGDIIHVDEAENDTWQNVSITSEDKHRQLLLIHTISLHKASGVVRMNTQITNMGDAALDVSWCAAPTLPVADDHSKILTFEGRWSKEFQQLSLDLNIGGYVRENRKGHTSHDAFPGFVLHHPATNEANGSCFGFHLGWSGNHKMRVDTLGDGRSYAQLGELLLPGEVILQQGQSYQSPDLFVAHSNEGFTALSQQFHRYVRAELVTDAVKAKPRPVHYNTWEGIYFDHDMATLTELAQKAASAGAERFVLDDGWFIGRRSDKAGLGDWFVDKTIYPEGLTPLINTVNELGMEFGLWFEPEMVNPDSNLYRDHPDWILSSHNNPQIPFRHQYVLDLTREEVTEYLFTCIDDILQEYPQIAYIKWDMNRDINHPGNAEGKPAIHKQTLALYELIARVKKAHPTVEIESCCSGGGRIDYGILRYTDRVWTSDSNDALDRLTIQRGASFFIPTEIMGAHVGPLDCHITGRRVSMDMRAAVAMFGHMGIEMDPRMLSDDEERSLKAALALYKTHRSLIHSGDLIRLEGGTEAQKMAVNFAILNESKSHGLYAWNQVAESVRYLPPRFRFSGLDPAKQYKLDIIWPTDMHDYSPSVTSQINGEVYSGELLSEMGMQVPVVFPQSSLIFELTEVSE